MEEVTRKIKVFGYDGELTEYTVHELEDSSIYQPTCPHQFKIRTEKGYMCLACKTKLS